jgi:DNA replication and repair protein RecF
MHVSHLSLAHVRNYARLELELSARVHVFEGANAQGKTNLLESIYYLATTRSPMTTSDRELIAWSAGAEPIPNAQLEATVARGGEVQTVAMALVLEPEPAPTGTLRRRIWVNGVPRRAMDALGVLNVVLFLPEDTALVAGAPSERRRYLDVTLCQIDVGYCRALSRYNRVVAQRNALLRQVREGRVSGREAQAERGAWDEQLVRLGAVVLARRIEAVADLARLAGDLHPALTGGNEALSITYRSTLDEWAAAHAEWEDAATLEERYREALRNAARDEARRGVTLVGPHRDDLRFTLNCYDATVYGSRGQQRTVALSLKLAELAYMRTVTGEAPVLLLDDVASELDRTRSHRLLDMVGDVEQVLITITDSAVLDPSVLGRAVRWEVDEGEIRPLG